MLSGWAAPVALGEVEEARRKLKNGMVLTLIFVKLGFVLILGLLVGWKLSWKDETTSAVQVLGKQTRYAALQNTTYRIERSKDHNSISGVCRGDGCLQG